MTLNLMPLSEADPEAVEALLDAAFGSDRHTRTAYRIREGMTPIPDLSFAAFDGDRLVGTLQSWPVELRGDALPTPLILVGPVAVAPDMQRSGIGHALMERLLDDAQKLSLTMIGDPEYYSRFFGFSAEWTADWDVPGPVERHRLLARSARPLPASGILGPRTFAIAEASA